MGYDRGFYAEAFINGEWRAINYRNGRLSYVWQRRRGCHDFLDEMCDSSLPALKSSELSLDVRKTTYSNGGEYHHTCLPFRKIVDYMETRYPAESADETNIVITYKRDEDKEFAEKQKYRRYRYGRNACFR